MNRLTKTEQRLIDRARESRHNRGYVQIGYRTGRKNSFYGSRESDALSKLVKKGLVRVLSQTRYVDAHSRYSDHYSETIYELVDPTQPATEQAPVTPVTRVL